jgi:membrane-associated protease RseP (regulator of RpoE activity)
LAVRRGAVITGIEQGSAADRAGLPLGAVIVAFNGRKIDSPDDLIQAVQTATPGRDVELTYYDRDKLARKRVHLAAAAPPEVVAIPNDQVRPLSPVPGTPAPGSSSNLERELGGEGTRPLLGRLGRVIDGLAAPAQGIAPAQPEVVNRVEADSEVAELRHQLVELTKQVDSLRKQVADLEKRIAAERK